MYYPSAQMCLFFLKTCELTHYKREMRKIFPKKGNLASEIKTLIEIRVRMEEILLDKRSR